MSEKPMFIFAEFFCKFRSVGYEMERQEESPTRIEPDC